VPDFADIFEAQNRWHLKFPLPFPPTLLRACFFKEGIFLVVPISPLTKGDQGEFFGK
jgi:hypothetical protein